MPKCVLFGPRVVNWDGYNHGPHYNFSQAKAGRIARAKSPRLNGVGRNQKENRAGGPGFYASSRDAVTSKRGATGDDAPGGFARACIASRQEKSEEERGNSAFPGARPGPNHDLMFCLTKDLQVTEIKCHYRCLALVEILEPS